MYPVTYFIIPQTNSTYAIAFFTTLISNKHTQAEQFDAVPRAASTLRPFLILEAVGGRAFRVKYEYAREMRPRDI